MKEVVIVSGVRTAIGAFGGSLKDVPVVKLGSLVIKEALKRAGLRPVSGRELLDYAPDVLKGELATELERNYYEWDDTLQEVQVDEVIMGHVLQGGNGQNTARQAAIYAGIPKESTAFTVNKVCGSGLKAIALGAQAIIAGEAEVVVAGGMENMSQAPYILPRARWGYRMDVGARGECIDLMVYDGLWEIFYGYHMGNTAENIAAKYGITRREQDELGLLSHQRARAAIKEGLFKQEIVPVPVPQKKGEPVLFDTDERPMDTSMEKMAKLRPVFRPDGTVTAGNASGINDAAAAVVLMSREKAEELGLKPWVAIKSFASGGVDPAYMGTGPVPAVRKALKKAGLTIGDIDVVELNEAFAAQALACMRELGLSLEKTNPLGSGISLGHPIGCTGARLVVTIMHEMKRRNLGTGLVTMCIGGGQGMAMVLENI
ncbi:acetyl-CoA acetyltransferase [Desulfofundulus australicus DSM 11792]|uniref:Acetyl-CoA acetyltransferase n=1 Tax=Desulfofundulus australicus DSM 11792 TaxID=1121425 RepID=A0A1M5DA68_9FIRM|nr:acetyl-CoA C-acetyltransferase [Desulfofundulus australicus]SHF63780.1 acetyl-CoA acetyltransferase [Desulfofundulus australicus DSM 11792]